MFPAPALSYVPASQMNAWDDGQADDVDPVQITEHMQLIQRAACIQRPVL